MAELSIKEQVEKAINESSSLIEALECVAAMYNIPSENIVVDDRLNSIRVQGDTILAPDKKNPSANVQSIVCAIGAVLDNIGQRIDQKLDTFQASQISKNGTTQRDADPSKGEVVGRFFDSEGSEIVAYSTGLVDMSPTKASLEKVRELRATKQIPDIQNDVALGSKPTGYFNDEDDVMNGVNDEEPAMEACDIAKAIGEDPLFLDLYDHYEGHSMGYNLLQEQGFHYVDSTHAMIQEAAKENEDSGSDVSSKDAMNVKHMRFDNSHLMKAVNLFTQAFEKIHPDGEDFEHVNTQAIMETSEWKEGVREIEQQFRCQLTIKFFPQRDTNCFTPIDPNMWRPKLKISKSKGFQLGGMTIGIGIAGDMLDQGVRKRDPKLFGQNIMCVFLHEIFHNITAMIRFYDFDFISSLSSTMMLAGATNNAKSRRIIFSNYANSVTGIGGKKLNLFQRKKLVRQMMYVSTVQDDARRLAELRKYMGEGYSTEDLEKWINAANAYMDRTKAEMEKNKKTSRKILSGLLMVGGCLCMCTILLIPLGMFMFSKGFDYSVTPEKFKAWLKDYTDHPDKEEYYCDLFAGIYNLPVHFLLGGNALNIGLKPNEADVDLLKRLSATEKELYQMSFAIYPTQSERAFAGYNIAKKALKEKKALSPECKKYMEWIVKNYSNIDETDIRENYNQATFNPKECDDLDAHIDRIIKGSSSVQVTESYKPH